MFDYFVGLALKGLSSASNRNNSVTLGQEIAKLKKEEKINYVHRFHLKKKRYLLRKKLCVEIQRVVISS